jgi:hypothetical protein
VLCVAVNRVLDPCITSISLAVTMAWSNELVVLYNSALAMSECNSCSPGKGGPVLCRNSVESGGEVDLTQFPRLLYPRNQARNQLPFCLVAGCENNGPSQVQDSRLIGAFPVPMVKLTTRLWDFVACMSLVTPHLSEPRLGLGTA